MRFDILAVDNAFECALQDIDPLLVRMRMHRSASTSRQTHEADDHALSFYTGTSGTRIARTARYLIDLVQFEHILAGPGSFGSRRTSNRSFAGHEAVSPINPVSHQRI